MMIILFIEYFRLSDYTKIPVEGDAESNKIKQRITLRDLLRELENLHRPITITFTY